MKTILVCNQKGGVGKSLCADEIAFSFERTGTLCSFFDLDSQGGTLHGTKSLPNAVVSVVDTPGALQKELSDWVRSADVIVVPTRMTPRDIDPLMRTRAAVEKNPSAKVIYVLNGWNRFRASKDFIQFFLKEFGNQNVVLIPQSEVFVQAATEGKSAVEFAPKTRAADAVYDLAQAVRSAAEFPLESRLWTQASVKEEKEA